MTIRVGGMSESIEITGKSKDELLDYVKWAVICQGFSWSAEMEEIFRSELAK